MDEEKFSIERFWKLMGVAPRGETVEDKDMEPDLSTEGKMFHVEHWLETDVREKETVGTEEKKPTVETESVADEVGEDRAEKAKPSEDRRDVLRSRAVRRDTAEVETVAKPRRVGVAKRVVEAVQRVFGWDEVEDGEASEAVAREDEVGEDEMSAVEHSARDEVEDIVVPRRRGWQEDVIVPREVERRVVDFGEGSEMAVVPKREKYVFAESDGILTESRRILTEFRKSDGGREVDLRAISRAIERDSRRY